MHYCRQPCCFLIAAIPMQTLVTVCWINCSTRKTATDLYLVYRYSCINIVTQQQILYAFYLLTPSCLYFSSYVIYCIGPHLTLWLPSFKPASLNIICTCMDALRENKLLNIVLLFPPFRLKMILSAWSATTFL